MLRQPSPPPIRNRYPKGNGYPSEGKIASEVKVRGATSPPSEVHPIISPWGAPRNRRPDPRAAATDSGA